MFATSFVLGYHGCERKVGETILAGKDHVTPSENVYDWLGHGAYFWENSPERVRARKIYSVHSTGDSPRP